MGQGHIRPFRRYGPVLFAAVRPDVHAARHGPRDTKSGCRPHHVLDARWDQFIVVINEHDPLTGNRTEPGIPGGGRARVRLPNHPDPATQIL
ncbi:MAG: hypothetical protein AMXMBFR58_31270 [Phycisphaerae bacterium]